MAQKLYEYSGGKTASEVRDSFLRTVRGGLIRIGVANPNVTPGSDYYVLGQALGNELEVLSANNVIAFDDTMPDTATGEALTKWLAVYGLSQRAAGPSIGSVVLSSSAATTIVSGTELIDSTGLRFEVITGGIYNDGDIVPVQAIDTGDATNHAEGDALRWVSAPPYAEEVAEVAPGGLTNGVDAEGEESARARLLDRIASIPKSGNWIHVTTGAEESHPSVQKAFCYPAAQGPGTFHVAVVAEPTATSKSRVVSTTYLNSTIRPYIQGAYPEHAYSVITTVTDVDTDLSIALTLPEAPTASIPGPGGGWLNGSPWPTPPDPSAPFCDVTAVTSSTVFTVNSDAAPVANVSKVSWLSSLEWKLYSATVVSYTGTGPYQVTLDVPFTGIAVGDYVWPSFEAQDEVIAALLEAFALMGPGEKTDNASLLTRAFRHPATYASWPSTLGAHLLRAISNASDTVEDASFLYRSDGVTSSTSPGGVISPEVLAFVDIEDPPNVYVPKHIGLYRLT
jgi:uncharacterized phage protein gp47/JayE